MSVVARLRGIQTICTMSTPCKEIDVLMCSCTRVDPFDMVLPLVKHLMLKFARCCQHWPAWQGTAHHSTAALLNCNDPVLLQPSYPIATPTGRLLNRFTKDTEAVDVSLAASLNSALTCMVAALLSMGVVVGVTPVMALAIIPLALIYNRVQVGMCGVGMVHWARAWAEGV